MWSTPRISVTEWAGGRGGVEVEGPEYMCEPVVKIAELDSRDAAAAFARDLRDLFERYGLPVPQLDLPPP